MNIVGLDASSKYLNVVIAKGELTWEASFEARKNSEQLPFLIGEGLKQMELSIDDIDAVALGKGPGSFTGLRMSFSFAKGLCMGRGMRLLAISDFKIISQPIKSLGPIGVLIDARRNSVYLALLEDGDFLIEPIRIDKKESVDLLKKAAAGKRLTLTGDALGVYEDTFRGLSKMEVCDKKHWYPTSGGLFECALVYLGENRLSDPALTLPEYLQAADWQVRKK